MPDFVERKSGMDDKIRQIYVLHPAIVLLDITGIRKERNMKIQIPKNIRQCGEGAGATDSMENMTERIYVEDYVMTFLRQARERCREGRFQAELYGRKEQEDGKTWFFVYAAGMPEDREKFSDYQWLGQACWDKDRQPEEYIADVQKKPESLCAVLNSEQGEPVFFLNENRYVKRADTFFIFYEKNEVMQNFLIEWYRKNDRLKESEHSDHAAQDFRRLYQERQNDIHEHKVISFLYAASLMLMILCCITGISAVNQYDKMRQMGQAIDHLALVMEERRLPEKTETTVTEAASAKNVGGMISAPEVAGTDEETTAEPSKDAEKQEEKVEEETAVQVVSQNVITVLPEEKKEADAENSVYIVKEGDTLAQISRILYGTSSRLVELCELNHIEDPNNIIVGQKILLPKE